jgi:ABC-type transport system involved in multi-copper enzyme maturation permease subunit
MNRSVVSALIRKDLRMSWQFLAAALVAGAGALALWQLASQTLAIAATVGFFIVLIMLGILPMMMIVNERKKQTLAFIMSLPVTAAQYAIAKLTTALGMFLIPWLVLVAVALSLIVSRGDVPNGIIPLALILMLIPLVGFLIQTSVAIVSESETRSLFTMGVINISYSFVWVGISTTPGLTRDLGSSSPVWSATVLSVLGAEAGLIAVVLAVALYLQSRKRDFV